MKRPILVTGASRGIGRAVAERLVGERHPVLGVFRGRHGSAVPAGVEGLSVDLTDAEAPGRIVAALAGRPLAGLVSAAGVVVRAPFSAESVDGVDPLLHQLRVDLEAPLLLIRTLLGAGALGQGTAIVLVSSNLARRALAGTTAYGIAKAGLERAVAGLARELGPCGIRVNAVAPGLLRTDMTADLADESMRAYAESVPLGRVGEASDVVGPIAFLLGPDAGYVTGQTLDVDGGWGV